MFCMNVRVSGHLCYKHCELMSFVILHHSCKHFNNITMQPDSKKGADICCCCFFL